MNTTNLTVLNDLFMFNVNIYYWRFEVIYSFDIQSSTSALDFVINVPPANGSCSINPLNGTTNTMFTINCFNWFDSNGIKDYSFSSKYLI
jgi:hypothetical protein